MDTSVRVACSPGNQVIIGESPVPIAHPLAHPNNESPLLRCSEVLEGADRRSIRTVTPRWSPFSRLSPPTLPTKRKRRSAPAQRR